MLISFILYILNCCVSKRRGWKSKRKEDLRSSMTDIKKERLAELRNITEILKELRTPASKSFNSM